MKAITKNAFLPERFFSDLSPATQASFTAAAVQRRYKTGQVVCVEGEPPTGLFILEEGWVKAARASPHGREQALLFLGPGEIFGDLSVFTGLPYPGTVTALEPVLIWMLERETMLNLVQRHPDLALAVIRRLSERVLHFVSLVEDLSLRSVEERLANMLLKHARESNGRLVVPRQEWRTLDEMATQLGTVRDVLGRKLRMLENQGILQVEKHAITIFDSQKLADLGNS
ncbi:MAG: Crp/Fnr family transcriptional regulator [Anaerolineaceae bacterium]|nr:Crp/Fnr family transcriptional regulator [Anaerolineaceae bacterium]